MTLTEDAATQLDIWLLRSTESCRYSQVFKFTTRTMSIHRSFTKCKAPDGPTHNGVSPSNRWLFVGRPPSSIKQNSNLNFLLHCFIIIQHNCFILFLLSGYYTWISKLNWLERISKFCILAMLVIDLKRIFGIACVIIFMICLPTTCHKLSYTRTCSLEDRHQLESQRKYAHLS